MLRHVHNTVQSKKILMEFILALSGIKVDK